MGYVGLNLHSLFIYFHAETCFFLWQNGLNNYTNFSFRTLRCLISGWRATYQSHRNVLYATRLVALFSGILNNVTFFQYH